MDWMNWPIFTKDWAAIEEILLLKALSTSGIDNWEETTNLLSLKSPERIENHYYTFYYKSKEDALPAASEVITSSRDPETYEVMTWDDSDNEGRVKANLQKIQDIA